MITTVLFFALSLIDGGIGIFLGVAFFFICLAVAFIAYKMLKKTVKMAVRMAIVAAILIAALVGTVAFFLIGGGETRPGKDVSPTQTPRKAR